MFTHLGNGCPMQMHRHDNIVQRVQRGRRLWITFIADGAAACRSSRSGTTCASPATIGASIVTDCTAPAGLGPGRYTLGRWDITIGDDMIPWAPDRSHLVGAAITMEQSAANLRDALQLPESAIRRLTRDNPRAAIGA